MARTHCLNARKTPTMASSLLALIDDIATILDDVAVLAKVATKKTAGVLGDDLALNAQQVSGVKADRELPVVWAVCKGSLLNKAILVPAALVISAFAPWLVTPLLMVGGAFLCFEGFEKLAHKFLHSPDEDVAHHNARVQALSDSAVDVVALEKEKVKGAIRTDFILSAEIIAITLGTVQSSPMATQVLVLSGIAVVMTLGVYGLVACIVKFDDGGLYMSQIQGETTLAQAQRSLGRGVLRSAPYLMKALSVAGTIAMFLVGGGILTHGFQPVHHAFEALSQSVGATAQPLLSMALDGVFGILAGGVVLLGVKAFQQLKPKVAA